MSRLTVWPYAFTLYTMRLIEAYRRGYSSAKVAGHTGLTKMGIPVSLRWMTLPELGFPRRPFNVYRRARRDIPADMVRTLLASPLSINGSVDLPFPTSTVGLMYFVEFDIAPAQNQVLDVTAYDLYGNVIPGLEYDSFYASSQLFAAPGIAGIRVSGTGTLNQILGVSQEDYANLSDWQLIQVVGLPAKKGELGSAYDDTIAQGYEIALTDGLTAAKERMEVTELFRGLPQDTGDASFPLPPWPPSNIPAYLNNLRLSSNLFPMIARCLMNSVDNSPAQMQSLYTETVNLDGIKQANLPGATPDPSQPSTATVPVVRVSMLAVTTDSDAATALGYGTVDVPAFDSEQANRTTNDTGAFLAARAEVSLNAVYDYMVTAPYVLTFGLSLELAALSQTALPVEEVSDFDAEMLQMHAVLNRDTTAQVNVELTWQAPSHPQANALLASRQPFQSVVLNTSRGSVVKGYDPYVGLPPASADPDTPPEDLSPNLQDAAGQLPVDGSAITRYLAAGIDVFGQWSGWTEADVTLVAAPIAKPGLRNVAFNAGTLPTSGKVVPYDLTIEILWDWTDRSPGVIRITGKFVAPGSNLGPAYLSGLSLANNGLFGPPLLLTWNYGANDPSTVPPNAVLPAIDSNHTGTVELLSDVSGVTGNQVMQYRVTLNGFMLDYTGADEVDLAMYATAIESIRPGEWSDANDPVQGYIGRIVKAHNPLPPVVSFTPPSINWTALPDAYNKARGILEWTADPSAAGYMVWESTESALLQLLSPGSPDPDLNALLVTRGATLKSLVSASYDKSLQSFSRLNTDPISGSRTEIELPGNASVLYAYMVSAVSSQGVEAPRSSQIAVFGVPRRMVPGQPRLRVRDLPVGTNGIQVIALAVETGVVPAGFRVYRVRNGALAGDTGSMGPPKIFESDPGWQPYTEAPLRGGTTATGQSIVDSAAMASWYPYYYRVVALGPDDPANGEYRGNSIPSQVQSGYCLPPNPPLIESLSFQTAFGAALAQYTIDLPIPPSPLAPSLVELLEAGPDPAHPGRVLQSVVLTSAPDKLEVSSLALPHFALPKPFPPPYRGPAFARSNPDAQGQWTLYALVPYASSQINTYSVRLTDPLGRQSSATF